MKKVFINNNVLILLGVLLIASSCSRYTDVVPVGQSYLTTIDDYNQLLNPTSSGSNVRHLYDDNEFKLLNDQSSANEIGITPVLTGGAWNMNSINYLFNESVSRINFVSSSNYNNQYSNIATYSLVIDKANTATTGTDSQKKQVIAEARALRAYCHFVLVNQYAKPYDPATAATDNAIIIKNSFNLEDILSPSTVEQVYNFIESELKLAIPDLSSSPVNAFHPSKAFGYGLLAKMYLFKGDIDNAMQAAQQSLALNSYVYDLVQYKQGGGTAPVDVSNPENLYYGMCVSAPDQIGVLNGYLMSKEFYNSFGTGDVRVDPILVSSSALGVPANSGCAGFIKQSTGATRFCYNSAGLRTTDVYLILAECYARQGNIAKAIEYVDDVRIKRILPANFIPSVATDRISAVKIVLDERRKEFLFGPNRFWDQKRLGREPDYAITVTRIFPYYTAGYPQQAYTLRPNSPLYIIPFARTVLAANPNIKQNSADQQ